MKRKSISGISMLTPLMIVLCLLTSSVSAKAQSEDGACSNRTLRGDYGFSVEGIVLAIPGVPLPPGAALPVRGVAMTHFDGKGNLTQVDHILVNGTPPPVAWTAGSGTYTVNADCTGTVVINIPGNPLSPVKLFFVLVKQGKEIRTVVEANAVTSIGVRID